MTNYDRSDGITFSVGDRVKFIDALFFREIQGKIGTVTRISNNYYYVIFNEKADRFPCKGTELEAVMKVGEQLEFAFMQEGSKDV